MYGTGGLNDEQSYDGFVGDVQLRMQTAFELVRKHIGQAAERNKRYYDIRVKPAKYKVGQWVTLTHDVLKQDKIDGLVNIPVHFASSEYLVQ